MKSQFVLRHFRILAIAVTLLGLLGGCGQRGPLYLPGKPEAVSTPPKPVPVTPTPPTSVAPISQ